jgi:signal peptidase I
MTSDEETAAGPVPVIPAPVVPAQAAPVSADQVPAGTAPAGTAPPGPVPGDTTPAADGPAPKSRRTGRARRRNRPFWQEFPILVVVALTIALLVKTFVVQAFFIPSGSMQNTLELYNKVLVNKLVYHFRPIRPGDIIVFDGAGSWTAPAPRPTSSDPVVALYDVTLRPLLSSIGGLFGSAPGQTDFIKRVIGVPGDHVACCNAQGLVTINGVALHEQSYLFPGNQPGDAPLGESGHFSLTVPPGRLWVLGDHRAISDDSRGHEDDPGNGTIPENEVIGRAFAIVWPPSRWTVLSIPATFQQKGILGGAFAAAGPAGPAVPYLPVSAGVAGAIPVAALWRRRRARPPRG